MGKHKDSYYRCCCGVHVHTFTFLVALLVVIFWSFVVAGIVFTGEYIFLLICFPPLFSYGCLLIGNRAELPGKYVPFLIVNFALVVGAFLFAGVSYLTGAAFVSHNFRIGFDGLETFIGSVSIMVATAAVIYAFFQFYYFYIVYRDYEWIKDRKSKKTNDKEEEKKPRETRQRRFYVDPKKLPKFCPCRKESPKKYSIKMEDSDDEEDNNKIVEKKKPTKFKRQVIDEEIDNLMSFPTVDENTALWRSETNLHRPWIGRRNIGFDRWPSQNDFGRSSSEHHLNRGNNDFSSWPSQILKEDNDGFNRWPSNHQLAIEKPNNDIWRITSV